jgi:hypothetical protein
VHSQHRTTAGVWVASAPAFRVHREELATVLVKTVRVAVSSSEDGIPHPSEWKGVGAPVLEVARVRSWTALQRASCLCGVEATEEGLIVVPTRNGGVTGGDRGFHHLRNLAIRVTDSDSGDDLLQALLRAEKLCEPS